MLSDEQRREVARILAEAEEQRAPVPPVVKAYPDADVVDAYEIQLLNVAARVSTGTPVVGHKVGLSSKAMQDMMGVDEPDYGHLLADMRVAAGERVDPCRYCHPRVEVEVGYILGAGLPGEGCTEADVLEATEAVAPAIELIDSRIADWRIGLVDTIADNASSAGFVLGPERVDPRTLDLRTIDATLTRNGRVVAEGRSDAVLGDPTTAVAWLARKVATFGVRLEPGHVILPGSCTRAIDVRPDDEFLATFTGLGSVHLAFADSTPGEAA